MTAPKSSKTGARNVGAHSSPPKCAIPPPGIGDLNVSSLHTEERVRTRSLAPNLLHIGSLSMHQLSRENIQGDLRNQGGFLGGNGRRIYDLPGWLSLGRRNYFVTI